MDNSRVTIITTYCSSEDEAAAIGNALLDNKLAACCNIRHCRSLYDWQGRVDEKEWILSIKTIPVNQETIFNRIKDLHSYDIPAILSETKLVNPDYFQWVMKACSKN